MALASISRAPWRRISLRTSRLSGNGTMRMSEVDWFTVAYFCALLARLVWVELHQGTPPFLSTPSTKFDNTSIPSGYNFNGGPDCRRDARSNWFQGRYLG